MNKTTDDLIFEVVNNFLLAIIVFLTAYPLYFTVIASISRPDMVAKGYVFLFPKGLNFEAYSNVFQNASIWIGYKNTIIYAIVVTFVNLVLTIPTAYALSKKWLYRRNIVMWIYVFTMYFSGGIIPKYLLMTSLGLKNTMWVIVLSESISIYNLIVAKNFFETAIPNDIYEASYIDGSSELKTFFVMALPLSMPIVAVMGLFYAVAQWNSFFDALIFINKESLYPLQLVLRNILILNQQLNMNSFADGQAEAMLKKAYLAESMKYALVFIASAPVLFVYPFVQKYFIKGIMMGSVKG